MSNTKLSGILEAVEAESKNPSPSHQNLARLFALYLKESIAPSANEIPPMNTLTTNATTVVADVIQEPEDEPEEKHEKKLKRKVKNSK